MQCLILAGGLGTRMKAISGDKPKALLPAGPGTFIDWQLKWLKKHGVSEAVLSVAFEGKKIEEHLAAAADDSYPRCKFIYDGPEFLGTGGAIKNALPLLEDDFIVTYGDSFLLIDVAALFKAHKKAATGLTISILKNDNAGDRSNIIFRNGKIEKYDKRRQSPEMDYIDYGMMAFNRDYFKGKAVKPKFDLSDVISQACAEKKAAPFVVTRPFYEIGSPAGYKGFCELLKKYHYDLDALSRGELC